MPKQNNDASESDKTQEVVSMMLIAYHQAAKVTQPGEQPLHLPPPFVAAQGASILGCGFLAVLPMGSNHLDSLFTQGGIQLVRVIGFISNQPLRCLRHQPSLQSSLHQRHLVRRSAGGTSGERKTRAVCHCHELRTFAPLGLSHLPPPFLATMKVPSMKHSERSRPPRSLRSWAKALRIPSRVPSRTQFWKRRWQVWYGGYRSGKSCQGAPVRSTQSTPLSTSRAGRQGRPRPSERLLGSGSNGSRIAHCSSVKSMISSCGVSPYELTTSSLFMRWVLITIATCL